MPKFVARLEAQDGSGHFRRSVIFADSKEEAQTTLEEREAGYAMYRLTTEELAELDKREKALKEGEVLPANDRSKLALHRQEKPYKLVDLEKEK